MSAPTDPLIALVPYLGPGDDGAAVWLHLSPGDRRRIAMRAARERDRPALWSLVEAWLRTFGLAGTAVSPATVRSYRTGLLALLDAWAREDLLRPDSDTATAYVRTLQRRGLAPSTIQARLAAGRGLYAALRWCRAVALDPFADCRPPRDQTAPWDKRVPYADDEVAALTQRSHNPSDRALVLLGAHAGLRAQECADLHWADVQVVRRDLIVRHGKGGKQRVVAISATLAEALAALPKRPDGYVLPYRTAGSAWRRLKAACAVAGVPFRGVHALRHSAGTRLYAETHDLEATARHLGHSKLETTRIYAKWSDRQLRETIGRW